MQTIWFIKYCVVTVVLNHLSYPCVALVHRMHIWTKLLLLKTF